MKKMMFPGRLALLVAVLVVVGMAAGVAVARAAAPVISDGTTAPSGHFRGPCSGCHRMTPTIPEIPVVTIDAPVASGEPSAALPTDAPQPKTGDATDTKKPVSTRHQTASEDRDSDDEQGEDTDHDEADEDDSDNDHETVGDDVHERDDHDGDSSERDSDSDHRDGDSDD